MSIITTELRYYLPAKGLLPSPLAALRNYLPYEGQRADRYLLFEEAASCGVKLREGYLEIKTLIQDHPELLPGAQSWEKLRLENAPPLENAMPVNKKRWLAFFDENLKTVKPEQGRHCQVEISELSLKNRLYHSLCFEAVAQHISDRLRLVLGVRQILLQKIDGLADLLNKQQPESYPAFLRKHHS